MIKTAVCLNCMVHQQSDGTVLYQLNQQAMPGCQIDWLINGVVVAHEEDFNRSLIISKTAHSILMKKYFPNTVYKEDCFESEPRTAVCHGPRNSSPDTGNNKTGVTIAVTVAAFLLHKWFL